MAKTFEKAVTGFNHNIKHKGKVYHVQTEDSGAANPHIITHLFVGGNILATRRSSYADLVKSESLSELVRGLMEEQHKEMLRSLVGGGDFVSARSACWKQQCKIWLCQFKRVESSDGTRSESGHRPSRGSRSHAGQFACRGLCYSFAASQTRAAASAVAAYEIDAEFLAPARGCCRSGLE
jgi:hypothetical protein